MDARAGRSEVVRRVSAVAGLFGILVLASWLLPEAARPGGFRPLSLISYGFLVIAAFTAGDVAERLSIPRITAYLLTGMVVGPDATGLVERELLGSVHWFGQATGEGLLGSDTVLPLTLLALCLMGLRAGAAVRPRELGVRFAARVGAQVGLVFLVCAGAVLAAIALGLAPGAPAKGALSAALVLAAIAVGGSPAAAAGVMESTGAAGPMARGSLASAALRELVAPVAFVVVLWRPYGGALPGVEPLPVVPLVAGGFTGLALVAIRRLRGRDAPLLTLGLVFAVGMVFASAVPYGPFTLFLVAGVVLAASRRFGEPVARSLDFAAAPVYVFFFATLGAAFPLSEALGALPLAVVLATARLGALFASGFIGARRYDGLATVAHAGVSVALALLAGELVPEWGPVIRSAALGAIVLSEVAGPLLACLVLRRAGEAVSDAVEDEDVEEERSPFEQLTRVGGELPAPPEDLPPAVREPLVRLLARVQEEMENYSDALGEALREGPFRYMGELTAAQGADPGTLRAFADATRRYAEQGRTPETLRQAIDSLITGLEAAVGTLRPTSVSESADDRAPLPRDGRVARARKAGLRALAWLGARRHARRVVRLDDLARYHLTGPLPMRLVPITNLAMRAAVVPLGEVARAAGSADGPGAPDATAVEYLSGLGDDVIARAMLLFADAMDDLYRDARVAGTPSLPERRVRPSRRFQENREGRRLLDESMARWRDVARGKAGRLLALLETDMAVPRVAGAISLAGTRAHALLERAMVAPLHRLSADVLAAREALGAHLADTTDSSSVVSRLHATRDSLVDQARHGSDGLGELRRRGDLAAVFGALRQELGAIADGIPDHLTVPARHTELPPEGLAPGPKAARLARLSAREVARSALVDTTAVSLVQVEERIAGLSEHARAALAQAVQIVRFHVDAAADEAAEAAGPDSAELVRELALGGLTRLTEHLRGDVAGLETERTDILARVAAESDAACGRLRRLLVDEQPDKAEAQAARRRDAPATAPARTGVEGRKKPAGLTGRTRRLVAWLTGVEGQEPRGDAFPIRAAARATLGHVAGLGLPVAYRRLFAFNPVGLDDFFVARERESEALADAFDRWSSGNPASVLVVGERGSGRTSLVDRFLVSLPPDVAVARADVVRRAPTERALLRLLGGGLGLQRPGSVKRLTEHLLAQRGRSVVVVEPLGRLHLRRPDRLGALHALQKLVGATAHKVLWIVVADPGALRAITALVPVDTVFTDTVHLGPLGRAEVEALVETRHHASGYQLRFQPPPGAAGTPQSDLRTRYFDALWRRSHGMPLLAVYEWLRSLRPDPSANTLIVDLPEELLLDMVDGLSLTDLLVLAQVHVHAGISLDEVTQLSSFPRAATVGSVRRLAWRHFLDCPEPDRFVVNPVMWPRIRAVLERRGVL